MEEEITQPSREELLGENERLRQENERLKEELTYDSITGLFRTQSEGRRRILGTIETIHAQGKKIGLVRLDLNNLRPWNKEFGHEGTDKLLEQFGKKLSSWSEARGGIAMRYHFKGDEFGVLLPAAGMDELIEMVGELTGFSLETETLKRIVECAFTPGFAYEDEPEVREKMKSLGYEENHLAKAGVFFTALSEIADKRERVEEERKEK